MANSDSDEDYDEEDNRRKPSSDSDEEDNSTSTTNNHHSNKKYSWKSILITTIVVVVIIIIIWAIMYNATPNALKAFVPKSLYTLNYSKEICNSTFPQVQSTAVVSKDSCLAKYPIPEPTQEQCLSKYPVTKQQCDEKFPVSPLVYSQEICNTRYPTQCAANETKCPTVSYTKSICRTNFPLDPNDLSDIAAARSGPFAIKNSEYSRDVCRSVHPLDPTSRIDKQSAREVFPYDSASASDKADARSKFPLDPASVSDRLAARTAFPVEASDYLRDVCRTKWPLDPKNADDMKSTRGPGFEITGADYTLANCRKTFPLDINNVDDWKIARSGEFAVNPAKYDDDYAKCNDNARDARIAKVVLLKDTTAINEVNSQDDRTFAVSEFRVWNKAQERISNDIITATYGPNMRGRYITGSKITTDWRDDNGFTFLHTGSCVPTATDAQCREYVLTHDDDSVRKHSIIFNITQPVLISKIEIVTRSDVNLLPRMDGVTMTLYNRAGQQIGPVRRLGALQSQNFYF